MLTYLCNKAVLREATKALLSIDGVNNAIAFPRRQDKSIYNNILDSYNIFKSINNKHNYFHDLSDQSQLKDAVHRYSYLSKVMWIYDFRPRL